MHWHLDWSAKDPAIIRLFQKREAAGKRSPSWDNRPIMREHLVDIWRGWNELRGTCVVGLAPAGIPPSEIIAWSRLHAFACEDEQRWVYRAIRKLDDAFLERVNKEKPKETGQVGNPEAVDRRTRVPPRRGRSHPRVR